MSAVATVLRRDRLIVATGLAFVAVAAWLYMIYEARRMNIAGRSSMNKSQLQRAVNARKR